MNDKRLYQCWSDIKQRCYNENNKAFHNYGARGIIMCDEWLDNFEKFKQWSLENGYNDNLTIDRINTNGNYEPSNCRWTTRKTQANNRRNNHLITIDNETHTLEEWISIKDFNKNTIMTRIMRGWKDEDLFNDLNDQELKIEINGVKKTLNEWSDETGIKKNVIISRKHSGKTGEDLIKQSNKKYIGLEKAREIREFYKNNSKLSYKELADIFNVKSTSTISDIINNKIYKE